MKHLASMPTDMALLALQRFAGCNNLEAVHDKSAYLQGIIRYSKYPPSPFRPPQLMTMECTMRYAKNKFCPNFARYYNLQFEEQHDNSQDITTDLLVRPCSMSSRVFWEKCSIFEVLEDAADQP